MAKTFDRCKLCNANKFLNSISLCKRCGKSSQSVEIRDAALKKKAENRKVAAKLAAQEEKAPEEITSAESVESTSQESLSDDSAQKKDE